MRLVKLSNSRFFYVEWREGGAKRRVSTRQTDRGQAEDFLAAFRLEMAEGAPSGWPTLPDVLDWYYDTYACEKPSAMQADIARSHLKAFFGSTPVNDARRAKQEAYVKHRQRLGRSNETIRRELSVLSAAMNRAHAFDRLPGPPPRVMSVPEGEPRERYLTRDEAAALFRQIRKDGARHLLLFARLALYTGARTSAILQLTWDRVDLQRGVLTYPLPGRVQTNKRAAVVPIDGHMVVALRSAKRRAKSANVIEYHGKPVVRVIRAFKRQAAKAGLPDITPHTLRHTFGTWAAATSPIFLVSRALGHRRVSTTERYAKASADSLRGVTDAVRAGQGRGKSPRRGK